MTCFALRTPYIVHRSSGLQQLAGMLAIGFEYAHAHQPVIELQSEAGDSLAAPEIGIQERRPGMQLLEYRSCPKIVLPGLAGSRGKRRDLAVSVAAYVPRFLSHR